MAGCPLPDEDKLLAAVYKYDICCGSINLHLGGMKDGGPGKLGHWSDSLEWDKEVAE